MRKRTIYLIVAFISPFFLNAQQYDTLKIVPHPDGGLYIGQTQLKAGDINLFETAIDRSVAWWSEYEIIDFVGGAPIFNTSNAEQAWSGGKIVVIHAYEATPNADGAPVGYTVDKLLNGDYETELIAFAEQLRQFGKPVFFNTAREPNGVLEEYFGGFGVNGNESLDWALTNNLGLAEFDPSIFPNSILYSDLGNPNISDGIERMIAAQRYYYNFFVNIEGLNFITFETMGWAALPTSVVVAELQGDFDHPNDEILIKTSFDFKVFYPGDEYVDWVSINWYMTDDGEDGATPIQQHLDYLDSLMFDISMVAPNKPVFFIELGFPDSIQATNSNWSAQKIYSGFNKIIIDYPNIQGFSMWSDSDNYWDCLIRPNTIQADTLKSIMDNNPDYFHSCVYFSDGSMHPNCDIASIQDISLNNNNISIFPNPANNFITVKFHDPVISKYNITIYDIRGRLHIFKNNLSQNVLKIDMHELSTGVYFLKVESEAIINQVYKIFLVK